MVAAYDGAGEPAGPQRPDVFVRAFSVPPGFPWDQARAAGLEARHASPLPINDLLFRLQRLERWKPGAPARYAVVYLRRVDSTAPIETTVTVEGIPVKVAFGSRRAPFAAAQRAGVVIAAAVVVLLLVGMSVLAALERRSDAEVRLAALERRVSARARDVDRLEQDRARGKALEAAKGAGGFPADVIADLNWTTFARTADARVVAFHWDRGLVAVEARGDAVPLRASGRRLVRSETPSADGVWIWGVEPPTARDGRAQPVAAEFAR